MYKPTCPRQQTISMLLDIEEDNTIMLGRKRFAGLAQLQRIIQYLVETL